MFRWLRNLPKRPGRIKMEIRNPADQLARGGFFTVAEHRNSGFKPNFHWRGKQKFLIYEHCVNNDHRTAVRESRVTVVPEPSVG